MLFASDLCFICKYFQSRCNFVQLLQVFINKLMRWIRGMDLRNYGLSHDNYDDDDEEEEGFRCLSSLLQLCFELLCHSIAKAW